MQFAPLAVVVSTCFFTFPLIRQVRRASLSSLCLQTRSQSPAKGPFTQNSVHTSVWTEKCVSWSPNLGDTEKNEIISDVWDGACDVASAEDDMAKDLGKNSSHIGARLSWRG